MKITVSLSRLHKLSERIKSMMHEHNNDAMTHLGKSKTWRVAPTEDVQIRLRAAVEKGRAAAVEGVRLARELAKVRAVISSHNETRGISKRMALAAALQVQMDALKQVLAHSAMYTSIEELPVGSPVPEAGITTNLLTDEDRVSITAEHDELQREVYRLTDENAEENSKSVEIELPEDLAQLVSA